MIFISEMAREALNSDVQNVPVFEALGTWRTREAGAGPGTLVSVESEALSPN